jgi:UDP-N-acetylmuramoyl-tripeptide--D-alanyl-D-alanine ligase
MLAMQPDDDFAVLELGASAAGEIGRLAALCQPQIGVITRVGDAHLGGFGSVDAVAEAKSELLDALPHDGCAVLNGDDPRLRRLAPRVRGKVVWVGRALDNDIVATHIESGPGSLTFTVDGTQITVGVWGRHHLTGALAAVAVGRQFGLSDEQIAEGLSRFQALPMRCQIRRVGEATIIDDTYNSSPVAMHAALELLRDFDAPGRRIVVCGDMREMGDAAEALHEQLGEQIVTVCGADLLLACGEQAHHVVAGACNAGMPRAAAFACRRVDDMLQHWPTELQPGDVMLVKGSRALEMERLVAALTERAQSCAV